VRVLTCAAALFLFLLSPAIVAAPLLDKLLIIAPAAPGGGWDQTARAMQHALQAEGLVRHVEVENVAGAAGTIGLAQFVSAEGGNGAALLVSGLVMLGATIWNDSPVSLGQVAPIARLTAEYEVIAVPTASPHRDMRSLADALRAHPRGVSWGGGSAGGTDHILAGLVLKAAGGDVSKLNYVPFSGGGEALAAIRGGHVAAGISGYSEWEGQIKSGELRALAISAPERQQGIDIPTIKEQGFDVELANWRAVVAPPGLDEAQKKALLDAVDMTVKSDAWKKVLVEKNWTDLYLPGEQFAELITAENARVTEILKGIGLVQ